MTEVKLPKWSGSIAISLPDRALSEPGSDSNAGDRELVVSSGKVLVTLCKHCQGPDALVGPFSTELSEIAAEATSGSELLLLLPGAASSATFGRGFPHIVGRGLREQKAASHLDSRRRAVLPRSLGFCRKLHG